MFTDENKIRSLAKTGYWQNLFRSSKETNGIHLFENMTNFSAVQTSFLYWLRVYNMLFDEMNAKDWPVLDEQMIRDDIRCDAFLYYREKEISKKIGERKADEKKYSRKNSAKPHEKEFKIYKGPIKSKSVKSDK